MAETRRSHPSLPVNYVSISDLRERWLKQKQQKQGGQDEQKQQQFQQESLSTLVENGDEKGNWLGDRRRNGAMADTNSNLNPNPTAPCPSCSSFRANNHENRRWIRVSYPKPPPAVLEPKESGETEAAGSVGLETKASDRKADEAPMASKGVQRKNEKKGKKKANSGHEREEAPKEETAIAGKSVADASNRVFVGNIGFKKERDMPERKYGVRKRGARDDSMAEIEWSLAGLSTGYDRGKSSSSRRLLTASVRPGWRRDGSYGKFQSRITAKQGVEKSGLVWVKKGVSPD